LAVKNALERAADDLVLHLTGAGPQAIVAGDRDVVGKDAISAPISWPSWTL